METPRLFTLDEANALLPKVRPLVESMVASKKAADKARSEYEVLDESHARGNGFELKRETLAAHIAQSMRSIRHDLEMLQELGCHVKDLDIGLLDFHSLREGQIVNLCWMLGEPEITYWHSLDSGFASRKPLEP